MLLCSIHLLLEFIGRRLFVKRLGSFPLRRAAAENVMEHVLQTHTGEVRHLSAIQIVDELAKAGSLPNSKGIPSPL